MRFKDGTEKLIQSASDFPEHTDINVMRLLESIEEPVIEATIFAPDQYAGAILTLCSEYRGQQQSFAYLDAASDHPANRKRIKLVYILPLSSIVTTFHSALKSVSNVSFRSEKVGAAMICGTGLRKSGLRERRLPAQRARQAQHPRQRPSRRRALQRVAPQQCRRRGQRHLDQAQGGGGAAAV